MKWLTGLAALLSSLATPVGLLAADATQPPSVDAYIHPQTRVRLPDGRNFNLVCEGKGTPTAILDGSLSQWSFEWRAIQPAFSQITRTCAVDRAGFGFSDPGPLPRDAAAEVSDLQDALRAAKIGGPYVLVGHSLGGQEMRLLAYRWPKLVAAILLIDPGIEHVSKRLSYPPGYLKADFPFYTYCFQQAVSGKIVPGAKRAPDEDACADQPNPARPIADQKGIVAIETRPSIFSTIMAEIDSQDTSSSAEIDAARHPLGSIPLVILSSDKVHFTADTPAGVDSDAFYKAWIAAHVDQARDSSQGENRIVDGASHWIFNERPDVVIAAFREVVGEARHQLTQALAR
ncbi:alpha/beta fold hydrolase [Caulobacter sp. S45]|uniref:alpha/beta fold hydrolase n=1 Tax=Caulobacter sp. S45 TaxID=1641861 RepID=UPI00131D909B|nr:alpha/beta hydrolase [Caulobacter sp. S45]